MELLEWPLDRVDLAVDLPATDGPRVPGGPDGLTSGHDTPPVMLVDARRDLAAHRDLARQIATSHAQLARVVLLAPEDLAAWSLRWEADDLLLTTAGPGEVTARVRVAQQRAALRREPAPSAAASPQDASRADDPADSTVPGVAPTGPADRIDLGDLVIHRESWSARLRGRTLDLTFREFELLAHLAEHPGRVFTREELLDDLWEGTRLSGTRTVDVHVRRLRAKLGPEHEGLISTVRNVGYRMETHG